MRLFSFGGYGLALAALALVVFGANDSYPDRDEKKFNLSRDKDRDTVARGTPPHGYVCLVNSLRASQPVGATRQEVSRS